MQRIDMNMVALKLHQDLTLPEGYVVEVSESGNIVVKGPEYGFCVTQKWFDTYGYDGALPGIMQKLKSLVAIEDKDPSLQIHTLEQLAQQAKN